MKAYYFEGEMGNKVIEKEIPENMKADAEKFHSELIEKIVKDHATSETIELENNLTPQVNWQFYRYFF